jgi:hypothetical protein
MAAARVSFVTDLDKELAEVFSIEQLDQRFRKAFKAFDDLFA